MRLRRSDPSEPGLARRRHGSGFSYAGPDGARLTEPEVLARIDELRIPPAWQDVWICPWPNGHLQVLGTDDAGRRQYLYHEAWRVRRDREKYVRAESLGRCLPVVRTRLQGHLDDAGLSRTRVLAAALRLVDLGLFRAGGEEYARTNGSVGLATAQREHVVVRKGSVVLSFQAKSGVMFSQEIEDPSVCEVVRALVRRKDPSGQLLAWWEPGERAWKGVRSDQLNVFLREVAKQELTVKDFRTWHASVLMSMTLADEPPDVGHTRRQRVIATAYKQVAEVLHNTPAVTRSAYVDPRVIDLWQAGRGLPRASASTELVPLKASRALTRLLRVA